MASAVTLRLIRPGDEGFLCQVYASTRAEELTLVDWDPAQKEAFCRMQFEAQHQYYQENYQGAAFQVIVRDGVSVGRLYVARWEDEIRIVDIALLPEHRSAGIGTLLLTDLLEEARQAGKRVSIHVEKFNRAQELYRRLGFVPVKDAGVYMLMEWTP